MNIDEALEKLMDAHSRAIFYATNPSYDEKRRMRESIMMANAMKNKNPKPRWQTGEIISAWIDRERKR